MIWIVIVALTCCALLFVLPPFFRLTTPTASASSSLSVYRDQLTEVESDIQRGLISPQEAEAARIEIKRRILALGDDPRQPPVHPTAKPLGVVLGLFIVIVSLSIYLEIGRPSLPGQAYSAEAESNAGTLADEAGAMIAKLEAHLKTNPKDVDGWRALGWAQMQLGQPGAGVEALRRATLLAPSDAALLGLFAEALVRKAEGDVGDEALSVFARVLNIDPKDPRARFYKGLALVQKGKEGEALDLWAGIIRDGPPDAEWLPAIRKQVLELAKKLKRDPATLSMPGGAPIK